MDAQLVGTRAGEVDGPSETAAALYEILLS